MLSAELCNEDYQSLEMAAKELDRTLGRKGGIQALIKQGCDWEIWEYGTPKSTGLLDCQWWSSFSTSKLQLKKGWNRHISPFSDTIISDISVGSCRMWPADAYPRYKLEWPSCNSVAVDWTRRHRLFEVFIFRKVLWYWKHFTTKALESRLLWIPLMLQWASSDLNTTSVPQLVPDWCPPNLWQLTGLAPWNPWRFAVRPATGSTPTSGVTTTPTEGAPCQGKQGTSRPKLWNPSEFVERSLDT